jgi:predicted nucleotidyltransferase
MIQKICKEVVDEYKKNSNVLGIALFGSAAREKFDQYSDVDIYILLRKKKYYSRINFLKNKVRVDIILDTLKEADVCIKNDKFNVKRITSHMLAHSKILYRASDDLDRIIKKAKQNLVLPTKYTKNEILMHKYSIDDFWGEVQRDKKNVDFIAFGLDSQLLLNNIIELFLKLHGEFWRQPNEMFKILNRIDKNFTKKIENFYEAKNINTKKQILGRLVMDIYKKSHGLLPNKWMIK